MATRAERKKAAEAAARAAAEGGADPKPPVEDHSDAPEAPEGFATLTAPDGATECSWGGENYPVDDEGYVQVPAEAVRDLFSHGYRPL